MITKHRPIIPPDSRLHTRAEMRPKRFEVPVQRTSKAKLIFQTVAIFVLTTTLGLAAGVQQIGEIAIAVYAVVAVVARFSSRTTFVLVLLAFSMIILLETVNPTGNLAANFAVYAFLLMAVGTLSLALEVRQEAKWEKWRRQPKQGRRG